MTIDLEAARKLADDTEYGLSASIVLNMRTVLASVPDTIRALADEVERLQKERDDWKKAVEQVAEQVGNAADLYRLRAEGLEREVEEVQRRESLLGAALIDKGKRHNADAMRVKRLEVELARLREAAKLGLAFIVDVDRFATPGEDGSEGRAMELSVQREQAEAALRAALSQPEEG